MRDSIHINMILVVKVQPLHFILKCDDQTLAFNGEFPTQLPSPASTPSPAAVEVAEAAGGGGVVGRRGGGEHPPVLLPAAAHAVEPDALLEHAHPQALLEAARLARLPPTLVDLAVVGRGARVLDVS